VALAATGRHDAFQRARPEATPREREAWLLQERYGLAMAQRIMALDHIQGRDREVTTPPQSEMKQVCRVCKSEVSHASC